MQEAIAKRKTLESNINLKKRDKKKVEMEKRNFPVLIKQKRKFSLLKFPFFAGKVCAITKTLQKFISITCLTILIPNDNGKTAFMHLIKISLLIE